MLHLLSKTIEVMKQAL